MHWYSQSGIPEPNVTYFSRIPVARGGAALWAAKPVFEPACAYSADLDGIANGGSKAAMAGVDARSTNAECPILGKLSDIGGKMGSAPAVDILDQDWMRGMLIRWRLSEAFISSAQLDELPEESALRTIVTRDLPILIREVLRLRPELGIPALNL